MLGLPDDHITYKILKHVEEAPEDSQRARSEALGISLGKVNYCLKALIGKGWVKVKNFQRSDNKCGYVYLLTPQGLEEKSRVTIRFLNRKMTEYERLRREIEQLKQEVDTSATSPEQRS